MAELFNVSSATISEEKPSTNYAGSPAMSARNTADRRVMEQISLPMIPRGQNAQINSYILYLTPREGFPERQLNLRAIRERWSASTATWSKRATTGALVVESSAVGTAGQSLAFDLTEQARKWLAGSEANYGVRLETNSTTVTLRFHSANASGANAQYRPRVVVDWAATPGAPSGFTVTSNRQVSVEQPVIPWSFTDPAGRAMSAYQLQTNNSDAWENPATDSGEVAASVPQHKLVEGVDVGETVWYRVRHKNDAGLWSDWSAGQQFGRTAKPALTINSPVGEVNDFTPTATWSLDGAQTAWRAMFVRDRATGQVVDDSLEQAGAAQQYEPGEPLPYQMGEKAWFRLRVRDDVQRVDTPGDPSYIEAVSEFVIYPGDTAGVENLAVRRADVGPLAEVTWTRSSTPDSYIVERRVDGGAWKVFEVAPSRVAVSATQNRYVDPSTPMFRRAEYRVRAVENGQMSRDEQVVVIERINPHYIWLIDPDDPDWLLPVAGNEQGTLAMAEQSEVVEVRGSDRASIVHEAVRGYEGSVSGVWVGDLPNVGGLSVNDLIDRAWRLKREPVKVWRLVIGPLNIPVVLQGVNPAPQPGGEVSYGVEFGFFQQGELWWAEDGR